MNCNDLGHSFAGARKNYLRKEFLPKKDSSMTAGAEEEEIVQLVVQLALYFNIFYSS
jgi:hypothetical protein